jgi:trigger factor
VEITAEPLEPRQVQLTIVVPPERVERAMNEAAQAYARRQSVPGYRPGKVPLSRVVAIVGEEPLREAAVEKLQEQVVREAIKEQALRPGGPASVEVVTQDPLTVRAVVPLEPLVELGDYHALEVPAPSLREIGDADVEAVFEGWRNDMATLQSVDRAAEAGDTVRVRLVGRLGEKIVHEDENLMLPLTPEGATAANVPPDVVDELVGLAAGDARTFVVHYSEFWPQPELQAQDVAFEAGVAEVSARIPPEIDDKLAHDLGGADSVADLRRRVRTQLQVRALMQAQDEHVAAAVDALVAVSVVSYPPAVLDLEVAGILADLRQRVERQGFTWDRWLELQQKDEDALWAEVQPEAEARLKRRLVMTEFVRLEGIDVGKGEIDAEVKRLTDSLSPAARRGMPDIKEMRRSTGARMLSNRAVERLLEIVTPAGAEADAVAGGATGPGDARATGSEGEGTDSQGDESHGG